MHTRAWLCWLVAAAAIATLAPHPLYHIVLILVVTQVFVARRDDRPLARSFALFARAGFIIWLGYVVFAVVTAGGPRGTTILMALPAFRLPVWLGGIVLGGPVTAEALAWGATRGLGLWTLLLIFGAFNALVDHHRLLRLVPRSLFHAGLAVTIALALVPALVRSVQDITAAQRARGHRFGSLRSWWALIGPVLAGSLERSLHLAEALEARGYGRALATAPMRGRMLALLSGLLGMVTAILGWLWGGPATFPTLAPLGGISLVLVGWAARGLSHAVPRTTYRRERWHRHDTVACVAALTALIAVAAARLLDPAALVYYPFPTFTLPAFDLRIGLALLALIAPALPLRATTPRRARRLAADRRAARHEQAQSACAD